MANGHGGKRPGSGRKKKPTAEEVVKRPQHGGPRPNSGRPRDPWAYSKEDRANLLAYCREKQYDPVISMIELAQNEETPARIALQCHREVAKYIHPTLAATKVEHSGKIEGDLAGRSTEDLQAMADALRQRRLSDEKTFD